MDSLQIIDSAIKNTQGFILVGTGGNSDSLTPNKNVFCFFFNQYNIQMNFFSHMNTSPTCILKWYNSGACIFSEWPSPCHNKHVAFLIDMPICLHGFIIKIFCHMDCTDGADCYKVLNLLSATEIKTTMPDFPQLNTVVYCITKQVYLQACGQLSTFTDTTTLTFTGSGSISHFICFSAC